MNAFVKRSARDLIPPLIQRHLAYCIHRWRGDATIFTGDFPDWASAAKSVEGYAENGVLEKTRAAVRTARSNPDVFERDSCLLDKPDYAFPSLAFILWKALQAGGRLDVVDFGGSLGSTFFQIRPFLRAIPEVRWAVVEQPHFVECGRRDFSGDGLSFHNSISEALTEVRPELLFVSCVLQYLPAPHDVVQEMIGKGFRHILLDRTAFVPGHRDRLTVQHNPSSVQSASYPAWFFNEDRLLKHFATDYDMVASFDGADKVLLAAGSPYYRGYFLARRPRES
ncbi:MAG: methyltransferase, TIGR04325 family [Opitutaceae bacterium]|nr:methyltransferase, TIGR04325 family [Opitutaceae bacterium]